MTYDCTVRARRAGMTDEEFWADVAESLQPDVDTDGPDISPDDLVPVASPCPECGASGACAWDAEGRPLIHATPQEES